LKLPNSAINLKSGQTSRRKVLEIQGATRDDVACLANA
jgi:uncharacterized protein YggU (UPF0235/DUF167 family)